MENKDRDGYSYYQFISMNGIIDTADKNGTTVSKVVIEEKPEKVKKSRKVYDAVNSNRYSYCGPIYQWDKCVILEFKAETIAPSEKKAVQNIIYRAKKFLNLNPYAGGFKLGGKIKIIE